MASKGKSAYEVLVLEADQAPARYNIVASASNWVLLAGFAFLPGAFAALGHSSRLIETDAGKSIQNAVGNIPLLVIGCLSCSIGLAGIGWVLLRMKKNYVWFANRIFIPGLINATKALLIMLVNIFTAQDGIWSPTAIAGVTIAAAYGGLMGFMVVIFEYYIFENLKRISETGEQI